MGAEASITSYRPIPQGSRYLSNALLFRRTGRLEAAMLLHMTYNAVVLLG